MCCRSRHGNQLFQEKAGRRLHVGHSALGYRRPEMEVVPALRDGLYDDVDVLNALWDHAIRCTKGRSNKWYMYEMRQT